MLAMDDTQCWAHLHANRMGRLAINAAGRPNIFPVNYSAGDRALVFRTGPGTKLEYGPGSLSCFEIDGYDHVSQEGWSVMAFGRLREITNANDDGSINLRKLHVHPVAPGERLHWIAMEVEEVTGRRFSGGWIVPGNFYG